MAQSSRAIPQLLILIAITIVGVAPGAAQAQCAIDQSWDGFPPGFDVHGQDGWKGIGNDPFFSAITSAPADPASSPPRSLVVAGDSNLVHESTCSDPTDLHVFTGRVYVPSTFVAGVPIEPDPGSYFALLNTYSDGGAFAASVSVRFDPGGTANAFVGNGFSTKSVPVDPDKWAEIQIVVDLEDDWTTIYYDDELVTEYPWTGGIIGNGGGALDIAAVDLYANGSSSVYYDDLRLEALPKFEEDFDGFSFPGTLHGIDGWKGFDNDPARDAPISQSQARSSPQSVEIGGNSNVVKELEFPDNGAWSFEAWQYIPSNFVSGGGGGAFFVLYNTYSDGGTKDASVSVEIDSNLQELHVLHGNGSNSIDVPYDTDRWVKLQSIVDLDDDWTQIYYDGELVAEYTWTGGVLGSGGGALDIAAVDLFGNGSSPLYYDDLQLDRGCGFTRNSDADLDGSKLSEEFARGSDPCDPDSDQDTVPDGADNCPTTPNPTQDDCNYDGVGDACSPDANMDGVADVCEGLVIPTLPQWAALTLALGLTGAAMAAMTFRRTSHPYGG